MRSHMVTSYPLFLGGPIALHGLVRFLDTTGPSLTKVVMLIFSLSQMYIHEYILATCVYVCLSVWMDGRMDGGMGGQTDGR